MPEKAHESAGKRKGPLAAVRAIVRGAEQMGRQESFQKDLELGKRQLPERSRMGAWPAESGQESWEWQSEIRHQAVYIRPTT